MNQTKGQAPLDRNCRAQAAPVSAVTAEIPAAASGTNRVLPALSVGAIAGIDNIGVGLAIASLLFSGPLSSGLGIGVGTVLLAAVIIALVTALGSGFRNAVALVQESSVAVLAATLAAALADMPGDPTSRVSTALAIIGTSTVITGVVLWSTGALRLGRFVRLLPYPVVAGFIAASGWLLVEGAVPIMTGSSSLRDWLADVDPQRLWLSVVPAIGFSVTLLLGLRAVRGIYIAPLMLVGAIVSFHAILFAADVDLAHARVLGLLPSTNAGTHAVLPDPALLASVDWSRVLASWPGLLSVAAISLVGALLNTGGVELATGREANYDHELRVAGWANMAAGLGGGPSGYTGLGITVLAGRIGAHGREAGLATACVLLAGLFFAESLVGGIPVFVTSGLVLYLGLELLLTWLVETRRRLPVSEWLVVVLITAVVAFTGFVEGLLVGILVSAGVFIYNYSKLPVIRLEATGADRRSMVDRSAAASTQLQAHGNATVILRLQGYLFFATADRIVERVRQKPVESGTRRPRFLVLDFKHVSGIDSAAIASFLKIANLARFHSFEVLITQLPDDVRRQLTLGGLDLDAEFRVEPDLDHALEYCEERLLDDFADAAGGDGLREQLRAALGDHQRLPDLVASMTRLDLISGEFLIRAGEQADDVYFVASGWVRIQVTLPDGRKLRLRTMTRGAVVGEVAQYLGQRRTADVICEKPATVYRMARETLQRIEREDSELAALFHRTMAFALSEKLTIANRLIQSSES